MKLAKALNEKMMDVRIVDRLVAQGKISKEEVDKQLAALADEQGNYEQIENKKASNAEESASTAQ